MLLYNNVAELRRFRGALHSRKTGIAALGTELGKLGVIG
jgi:hypothetical protein